MRSVLLLGVLLALNGCCSARIRGVVRDESTGQPIPGATVRAGDVTANADATGFFDLSNLECEDFWRVVIGAPGYHLLSASVVPENGEDAELLVRDFPLVPLAPPPPAGASTPTTVPATAPRRPDEEREEEVAPETPDYRPRHAALPPAPPIQRLPLDPEDDGPARRTSPPPASPSDRRAAVLPPDPEDNRLYIKLTEDQSQALLQHMQTHGSERFAQALRRLIDSLPR